MVSVVCVWVGGGLGAGVWSWEDCWREDLILAGVLVLGNVGWRGRMRGVCFVR